MGYRHVVLLLGCLANIVSYTDRSSLSLTLLEMEKQLPYFGEAEQGIVLSAFFCGYLLTQVVGGLLSRRYGPKRVIVGAVFVWSAATLGTPSAASAGLGCLFAARVVLGLGEGVLLPCLHDLALAWVPPVERSTAASAMTSGQFVGTIIAYAASPLVSAWWPSVFYLFGGCGFLWCALFSALASSSPHEHRCVGAVELRHIASGRERDAIESDQQSLRTHRGDMELATGEAYTSSSHSGTVGAAECHMPSSSDSSTASSADSAGSRASVARLTGAAKRSCDVVPWRRLLCNRAALAIYVAHWTHNWAWYLLLSWLPKFLATQGADTTRAGFLSLVPMVAAFALANLGACVADRLLLTRLRLSVSTVRRIMGAVAHLGPAAALTCLALTPSPGPVLSSALACGAIGVGALVQSAFWSNIMDIAPRHAGVLLGISNTMATLPGILCNLSTGWMLEHGMGWTPVLALAACLEVAGATVYVTFARGEAQF